MRLLLLLLLVIGHTLCLCPAGFELVNGNECRGDYIQITATWTAAVSKCNEILTDPIIIHNAQDNTYWSDQAKKSPKTWALMGFSCNKTSQRWEWVDGTVLDYLPPRGQYASGLNNSCNEDWVGLMVTETGLWTYGTATDTYGMEVFCSAPLRQPSANDCDGSEVDSDNGVCYQVPATSVNWQDGQIACINVGATVASVHNTQENSFIRRLAVSHGAVSGVYLGAALTGNKNKLAWLEGSKWDYDNFYNGFPKKGMGQCLMMDTAVPTGEWANVDCSTEMAVACMGSTGVLGRFVVRRTSREQLIFAFSFQVIVQITSPGFPYDASEPCVFLLTVDVGKKVEIEIILLETVPVSDHLIVYENYFGSNIIANLTGIINDTKYTTSSSNFMRVSWQPNGGVNVRGVMFSYRAV